MSLVGVTILGSVLPGQVLANQEMEWRVNGGDSEEEEEEQVIEESFEVEEELSGASEIEESTEEIVDEIESDFSLVEAVENVEDSLDHIEIEPYKTSVDERTGIGYARGGYVPTEDSGMAATYLDSYKIVSFTPGKVTDIVLPKFVNGLTFADIDESVFANKGITSVSGGALVRRYRRSIFRDNEITSVDIPGQNVLRIESDAFSGNQIKNLSFGKKLDSIDANAFRNQRFSKVAAPNEQLSLSTLFADNQIVQTAIATGGGNSAITVSNISSSGMTYNSRTGLFTRTGKREPFTFDFSLSTIIDNNSIRYSGTYSIDYNMDETALVLKSHLIEVPQYAALDLYENIESVTDKYGNAVDKQQVSLSHMVDTDKPRTDSVRYYYDTVQKDVEVRVIAVYDLSFETNGGSQIPAQRVTVNDFWQVPEIPTKEGYQFDGWYSDNDYTELFDFNQLATESKTAYAKWIEDYTVIIPERITLNTHPDLKIRGVNRGNKQLSVEINRLETSISIDNQLILKHESDFEIECFAQLSWLGSDINGPILVIPSEHGTIEREETLSFENPKRAQAGHYEGNIVFTISYR
ncbi:InlB B-repeat-containing protein [Enterococcus sp. BWR-S5]|uniref:InlB B-repeat-containing protein n=1 Tax=Enterococcus sp. BWR-S5 TaxID=2787714 RepID=UPI0019238B7B|nr:InlB B-repeat-containing protein [Enterococcus sp. BWR-S5]MBL1225870.1 InlB B-repeat-containing protein [Enterococcus sp. BWR-S5]